jgi:uncharacterized protein with PIN domain
MKFILTRELGRLAKWLRILGFDTIYFKQDNIGSLIIEALREGRIILTRNHRLPASRGVRIVVIERERIQEQLAEVLKVLQLEPTSDMMFTRCIICNRELVSIKKESVKNKVPEYVFKTQDSFVTCPDCKRIYWSGTHWGNVTKTLEDVIKRNQKPEYRNQKNPFL